VNIEREIDFIVERAADHAAHFVSLGRLVLFSTETGDAWMLDPGDGGALRLAAGGNRQEFRVVDLPGRFLVDWTATYRIEGHVFAVTDRSGCERRISGYPIQHVLNAIRRAVRSGTGNPKAAGEVIGYSALDLDGLNVDCYEYNENECFVADSPESLHEFVDGIMLRADTYRTDEIRFSDMLADYGCSGGRFCLEPEARRRFERAAANAGIAYDIEDLGDGWVNAAIDPAALREERSAAAEELAYLSGVPAVKPLLAHICEDATEDAAEDVFLETGGMEDVDHGLPPDFFLDHDEFPGDADWEEGDPDGAWYRAPSGPKPMPEQDPYEPCRCGSGRKYKWCCRPKDRARKAGKG